MKIFALVLFAPLFQNAFAGLSAPDVVYGKDNRVDVIESDDGLFVELSRSTLAMLSPSALNQLPSGDYALVAPSLEETGWCAEERFSEQPAAANCSGFLVAPNLVVTAGHCIMSAHDCAHYKWVFDYKMEAPGQKDFTIDESNVYGCKNIVNQIYEGENDHALIELDRPVLDRAPLKLNLSHKAQAGDPLVVIGHPWGLPTKIADGAAVRETKELYFTANLDTYKSNSGSPVFNQRTGLVEGILVRGERDYVQKDGCKLTNYVKDDEGRGEDVTYISNIPGLLEL